MILQESTAVVPIRCRYRPRIHVTRAEIRRALRGLALVCGLVPALIVAGCGGGDGADSSTASQGASPSGKPAVGHAQVAARGGVLARRQQEVNIHSYRGVAIFSLRDGSAYTLVASTAGSAPQPLNVPAQSQPFDADIGRGPDGKPTVVVRLCGGASCGLSLLALDGSAPQSTGITVPRTVVRPTLWDRAIAWYEHGRVRTKTRTLVRVAKGTDVLGLDLFGQELALNVNASSLRGVCGRREIRLLRAGSQHARVLGSQICALNGQTFHGPTFDSGWLYFDRTCNTNCGASRYGTYRYRNGYYQIADDGRPLADWAWGGRARLGLPGPRAGWRRLQRSRRRLHSGLD